MGTQRLLRAGACVLCVLALGGPTTAQNPYRPLKERGALKGHTDEVIALCFSPDGSVLASAGKDHVVRLWDVKAAQELLVLKGHTQPVVALAFSTDGKTLASGDRGKAVRLWEVKTGKELRTLAGHEGGVRTVCFSPDGKALASTGEDRVLRVWEVATGAETTSHKPGGFGAHPVAFAPDGKTLAFAESSRVTLLDREGKVTAAQKHGNAVGCLAFIPDGKVLASGGTDGLVKVWAVNPPKEQFVIDGHVGPVDSVQFSTDGKSLLTAGSGDGRFQIWDAATGKSKGKYEIPSRTALVVSPDGTVVAAADGHAVKILAVPAK